MFQSTHPHGVRRYTTPLRLVGLCFNPRTHTGCDPHARLPHNLSASFNPRTHTGCDSSRILGANVLLSFNPRTHTGCDKLPPECQAIQIVSIHAPTRGATEDGAYLVFASCVSIHAPTRGATRLISHKVIVLWVSIHAPTRGATLAFCSCCNA